MTANATVSLGSMLSSYPGPLTLVTVQVLPLALTISRQGAKSAFGRNAVGLSWPSHINQGLCASQDAFLPHGRGNLWLCLSAYQLNMTRTLYLTGYR